MKLSKFNYPALVIAVFALASLALGAWYFSGRLSNAGVTFEASVSSDVQNAGVPFDIRLVVGNDSDNSLKDVSFSLVLPVGVALASGEDKRIASIDIDEVRPGEIRGESFSVVIVDAEEGSKELTAGVSYSLGSLTATFEKSAVVKVNYGQFPLTVDISSPLKVFAGEEFETSVKYKNNEERFLPAFKIKLEYPKVFTLSSAVPKQLGDSWNINTLSVGEAGEIKFKGNADLPDGSELNLSLKVLLPLGEREYSILTKPIKVLISQSPLSLKISLAGDKQYSAPGEMINYILAYQNNTNESFKNAVLTAKLVGAMYDFQSVVAEDASFSSSTRTVKWSPATLSSLSVIGPGEGGNVSFSVKIKDTFPIKKLNDKNFTVRVDARLESPTVSSGVTAEKTVASDFQESKISGMVEVSAIGFFRDAESLILNSGPWPPRVNSPTEFTVHWVLTNFSTDVSNVEVRTALPEGVVFTGKVKSSSTTLPTPDMETREVVWKISRLFATAGITTKAPEAVFQVRATPSDMMAGDYMLILGETTVTATDDFTGAALSMMAEPVTTRLSHDPSVEEEQGIVQN